MQRAGSYAANHTVATEIVCPLPARALAFYAHFLVADNVTGELRLPPTFSPEYPGAHGPDANYDISLLRWGLGLAIQLAEEYPGAPLCGGPDLAGWKRTLAPDVVSGRRQNQHPGDTLGNALWNPAPPLLTIWPLRLLDLANRTNHELARDSINLWLATPEKDSQFYRPAASAMNVLLGQKAAAFDNIIYVLANRIDGSTWYREGTAGSCTETPYHTAWAMTDWFDEKPRSFERTLARAHSDTDMVCTRTARWRKWCHTRPMYRS